MCRNNFVSRNNNEGGVFLYSALLAQVFLYKVQEPIVSWLSGSWLFHLPDLDSDSDCKPNGFYWQCRTFSTAQIPIPTAHYRNRDRNWNPIVLVTYRQPWAKNQNHIQKDVRSFISNYGNTFYALKWKSWIVLNVLLHFRMFPQVSHTYRCHICIT